MSTLNKKLIVFGTGKIAEVVSYYATHECGYAIAAYCVDAKFKTTDIFCGQPVVSFEEVEKTFSPAHHAMFIALGYHQLNALRQQKYEQALAKGYKLVNIISPHCLLPANVKVGQNCFIMPPALLHPCVEIGNNVFIWSGAMVGHHSVVEDHCWLTSSCQVSGNVRVGQNSFLAVNVTVGHSVTIGKKCFLGANTLVTKNLEDGQVVIAESSKPIRLNSEQFLRVSGFSSL